MKAQSFEAELEALIDSADYCVSIYAGDNYLNLKLIYLPKMSVRGEGGLAYIANGKVAERHWFGRRRWKKARKWVLREIRGHKELVRTVGQA